MQRLVCELCKSNNFTKDDEGYFVCDYCRTKYTQSQAQSMMVEGTVRLDRSGDVANLVAMSVNALATRNYRECYDYANRVLEIDPGHSEAWFLKGTSTGFLSSISQPRLGEAKWAFERAIEGAAPDRMSELQNSCAGHLEVFAVEVERESWDLALQEMSWDRHYPVSQEVQDSLATSYIWNPRRNPLDHYVAFAMKALQGLPVTRAVGERTHARPARLSAAAQQHAQAQIAWATEQIRQIDPAPQTKNSNPKKFLGIKLGPFT